MGSIPTNAFSAPRVRWVMQHKLMDEQKKQIEDGSFHTEKLGNVKRDRTMSENTDSGSSSTEKLGSLEKMVEPDFRPGKRLSG